MPDRPARPARWLLPDLDASQVGALAAELAIGAPAARVLAGRGYADAASARRFLQPSLGDLHDPFLLLGMNRALARLKQSLAAGERILLYGDYDVDGTTSVVILRKAIELAGGRSETYVPHRMRDGYGLHTDVIEQAAADGVKLLISLDTGIRAAAVVRRAGELGLDVIITDHHLPDSDLPPAAAVLNPRQPGCPYPEKNLCGAGVAFKLVQALLGSLDWPAGRVRRMTDSFLKMVAIGTVADVVPLTGENRVIVKYGLDGLRTVRNPGLRELLKVAGFSQGEPLSANQVAFRVAPRLNAAGRMDDAVQVIELLITEDESRARDIAAQLHALNRERQDTEAEILDLCLRVPVSEADAALVFAGENLHRGVVGIVANRLVERFHRPVFVLSVDPETGLAQGSGRSIRGFHLLEALESMPDLFTRFGGHRQAAGVALACGRVEEFRCRMNAYAREHLTAEELEPQLELDAALDFAEVNDRSVSEVLSLAPFGHGNPPPVFAVLGAEVAGPPVPFKDRHLRLCLRHGGRTLALKAWDLAERAAVLQAGARVDAAISFEEDSFARSRGYPGWAAVLKDVRAAG